jgi:hypothetical protein
VAICLDSALRALTPGEKRDGARVEFVLEAFKCSMSLARTGILSEEGPNAGAWERIVLNDPRMADVLKDCASVLDLLESMGQQSKTTDVEALRSEARLKACRAGDFFSRSGFI